jgi:hypothetical protein
MMVVSATSAAIAKLMPPRLWMRSAIVSYELVLFFVVLIEQKMDLVEGVARDLPMVLL